MPKSNSKKQLTDLAILGGPKAFQEKKHVGQPNIGNRQNFLERVNDLLDRKWLTNNGPYVQELEEKLACLLGVRNCIALSNGTSALMIAFKATDIAGEVIIPSFTFIATAHALQWMGITPVFCEIDPQTFTIAPDKVESLITKRTAAIVGVHVFGIPCQVKPLVDIAQKHNLKLIFDAAHAFGVTSGGRMIGSFGDAETFSFHATKFFHTLEGGAVTTENDELANKIRLMRNFGFAGHDRVSSLGINAKMNDMSAAMGLTLLSDLESSLEWNKMNYLAYKKELQTIQGISLIEFDENEKNNFQYIVIQVDAERAQIERDQLVAILNAENVLARRYFYPGCHKMEPYKSLPQYEKISLPETDSIAHQAICLPSGTALSTQEILHICEVIRFICNNGPEIKKHFPGSISGRID